MTLGGVRLALARWLAAPLLKQLQTRFQSNASIFGGSDHGAPRFTPPEFQEALKKIPTVYKAINRLSSDIAAVPREIGRLDQNGEFVALDPNRDRVAALFADVNAVDGPVGYWKKLWMARLGVGEAFTLLDKQGRAVPQEIFLLSTGRMKVIPGEALRPQGYVYMTAGGREIRYEPEEIWHSKFPNPLDDWYGLPPLMAAQISAANELQALVHENRFFKHGLRASGVLMHKENLSPAQVDEILAVFERAYQGTEKAHKPVLVHGGADFKPNTQSHKDADFLNLRKLSREDILGVFGVPPALVGIFEFANYANSEQQERFYWLNTIASHLREEQDELNQNVLPRLGTGLRIRYRLDQVPAMERIMLEKAERLSRLVSFGLLTVNRAREEIGEKPVVGGDAALIPPNLVPLGPELTTSPVRSVDPLAHRPTPAGVRGKAKLIETPERNRLREKAQAELEDFERPFRSRMRSFFEEQGARVLARLERLEKARSGSRIKQLDPDDLDLLFPEPEERALLAAVLNSIFTSIITHAGGRAFEQITGEQGFFLGAEDVVEFLDTQGALKVTAITKQTRERLRGLLISAVNEGFTVLQLAGAVETQFEGMGRVRSLAIARTETTMAMNFATMKGWEQTGDVEKHEWLSARDDAVRTFPDSDFDHAIDGEAVKIGEPFSNGLRFPGDPSGEAGNVINCRCTLIPVVKAPTRSVRISPRLFEELALTNGRHA